MPTELETFNKFGVSASAEGLVILTWQRRITKADALILAAWLVALADDDDTFPALLKAVQST